MGHLERRERWGRLDDIKVKDTGCGSFRETRSGVQRVDGIKVKDNGVRHPASVAVKNDHVASKRPHDVYIVQKGAI